MPLEAQPRGTIRSTTHVTIKPDRIGDFQAAVKEYVAVLKKANWDKSVSVWRSATGPAEYIRSSYVEKWAELDMMQDPKLKDVAADLTRIGARIVQCTEKSDVVIGELQTDLSLPRPAELPKMIRVLHSLVKADKVPEYTALIKNEVLPAAKKGGAKLYTVARTRYGGPASEFVSSLGMESWADMDGSSPVIAGMGGMDAYNKFLAKVTPLLIRAQYDVYRLQPELSYQAGK